MSREQDVPQRKENESDLRNDDEVSLIDLWLVIWDGKFLIMGLTALLTIVAIVYALLATEWYRAGVLMMPAEDPNSAELGNQLSGLAAIVGVTAGGSASNSAEALAVLNSKNFARSFISDNELTETFAGEATRGDEPPDMRDAVRFFHENVLLLTENRDTGQVLLSVEWKDPDIAAEWANSLAARLNERMRRRALQDAETNIAFLQSEMATNNFIALEQSISRIVEVEMQKLMLARGSEEYSFRVIDAAEPPRLRSRPKRTVIVISTFIVSGILSLIIVFVRSAIRKNSRRHG